MTVTARGRGLAAACLVGALAGRSPAVPALAGAIGVAGLASAAAAQTAVDRSLLNGRLAADTLRGGLVEGGSAEDLSARGLKAEGLLVGVKAPDAPADAVQAGGSRTEGKRIHGLAASPRRGKTAEPGIPGLPPSGPEKPKGFLDGLRHGVSALFAPAAKGFGSMGKGKRVAILAGLLAVEVAAIVFPYQTVGVAMVALGALGLFGTAREVVQMLRGKR